jgi:hypothetical protein
MIYELSKLSGCMRFHLQIIYILTEQGFSEVVLFMYVCVWMYAV